MRRILLTVLILMSAALPLFAGERTRLGYGRVVNNDAFGDGRDRGHTASLQGSWIFGAEWRGQAPETPGALLELRAFGGILSPSYLDRPLAGDRPYAGFLGLGIHTHASRGALDWSAGIEAVATGPQTGMDRLQTALHDLLPGNSPSRAVLDAQIPNAVYPGVVAEIGRALPLGSTFVIRPFVEGRTGYETVLRGGVDVTLGQVTRGDLMVRDMTTGQRYRTARTSDAGTGLALVVGADVARVSHSVVLPESRGFVLSDHRARVRAGLHWQGAKSDAFYGVTWMGREFDGQPDDQLVGSLRLNLRF